MLNHFTLHTAHTPNTHEQLLAKLLRDYYFGELCPPEPVLRGMYDREFYEAGLNPSTIYREQRDIIDCIVVPCEIYGEPTLAAEITYYSEFGHCFGSKVEYWPMSIVEKFSVIIEK